MFRGKLALVTGAGSGIGKATCQLLAREGAKIIAADKDKISAQKTVESLKGMVDHSCLELDVGDESSVLKGLSSMKDDVPQLVVNSAGITRDSFILNMTTEDFTQVIDVNLKGSFLVIQGICRGLVERGVGGSIVNLASIIGQIGNMGQCNYAASKAGIEALTKTVAKEMGKHSIRCNAVVPGFIESPMTNAVPEKVKEIFRAKVPMARLGKPEEVAEVISFLLSDKSSYVNGASIQVTGGM